MGKTSVTLLSLLVIFILTVPRISAQGNNADDNIGLSRVVAYRGECGETFPPPTKVHRHSRAMRGVSRPNRVRNHPGP